MDNIVVEKRDHSKFGASGSFIWLNCHGSSTLRNKLEVYSTGGLAANEGTAAHELGAKCLIENRRPDEFRGKQIESGGYTFTVTQEMIDALNEYIDFVYQKLAQHPGAILRVEQPIHSIIDSDAWGTADVTIFVPDTQMPRIIVIDLKYGRGEVVEPHSSQLKEYGWLSYECKPADFPDSTDERGIIVELWIAQPRIPHPKGTIRKYITNVRELQTWFLDTAIPAMNANRDPNSPLTIGPWCKWCPARIRCPAVLNEIKSIDVSRDPIALTNDEITSLKAKFLAMKGYEDALDKEAFRRAMEGQKIAGWKLVNKKSNRVWKSGAETMAEMTFGDDAYDPKTFKGPAGVEKLEGGKDFCKRYAYTPVTGLTLAPESDKRMEARPSMMQYLEEAESSVDNLPC